MMNNLVDKQIDKPSKIRVTKAEIIVRGIADKPYFEIKYHKVGKSYNNIGFGSYSLENVFKWKDEYFEIVKGESANENNAKMTITCNRNNTNQIIISITDDNFEKDIDIIITPEQFALALTGLGYRDCNIER